MEEDTYTPSLCARLIHNTSMQLVPCGKRLDPEYEGGLPAKKNLCPLCAQAVAGHNIGKFKLIGGDRSRDHFYRTAQDFTPREHTYSEADRAKFVQDPTAFFRFMQSIGRMNTVDDYNFEAKTHRWNHRGRWPFDEEG